LFRASKFGFRILVPLSLQFAAATAASTANRFVIWQFFRHSSFVLRHFEQAREQEHE